MTSKSSATKRHKTETIQTPLKGMKSSFKWLHGRQEILYDRENGVYESGRRSFHEAYKDGNKEKKE